jgi:hypothetical protein
MAMLMQSFAYAQGLSHAPDQCRNDERFRAADFMLGQWLVYGKNHRAIANVEMRSVLNGCAIQQTWTVVEGKTGNVVGLMSFSPIVNDWIYAFATDYANNNYFVGHAAKVGEFLYSTEVKQADGRSRLRQWSLALQPSGEVIEKSVGSDDGGKSWRDEYELTWVKKR